MSGSSSIASSVRAGRAARSPRGRLTSSTEQLGQRPAAEHRLGPLGDDVRAGPRLVVAALDQQPLRLGARPRALEGDPAAQLLAVQDEDGVAALERLRPGDAATLLIGAA